LRELYENNDIGAWSYLNYLWIHFSKSRALCRAFCKGKQKNNYPDSLKIKILGGRYSNKGENETDKYNSRKYILGYPVAVGQY